MVAEIGTHGVSVNRRPAPPVADLHRPWNQPDEHGVIENPPRDVEPFALEHGNELPCCQAINSVRRLGRGGAAIAARILPGHGEENRTLSANRHAGDTLGRPLVLMQPVDCRQRFPTVSDGRRDHGLATHPSLSMLPSPGATSQPYVGCSIAGSLNAIEHN